MPNPERVSSIDSDTVVLLESWGFTEADLARIVDKIDQNGRTIVLDMGTLALDVDNRDDHSGDPFMGDLALVDNDNNVTGDENGLVFHEPPEAAQKEGHPGGLGNAANAIGKILDAEEDEREFPSEIRGDTRRAVWELMGITGSDFAADVFRNKIHPLIGQELLIPSDDVKGSGLSDIRVQAHDSDTGTKQGDRAIYFRAGASGTFKLTPELLLEALARQPQLMNISYPGLFPEGMDENEDQDFAWSVEQAQKFCPMVTADAHGFTKKEHVHGGLGKIDMFNTNVVEAMRIYLGEEIDAEHEPEGDELYTLHTRLNEAIRGYMEPPTGRTRMFTVSDKGGCFLVFQNTEGEISSSYVPSICAGISAVDKTGAGDVRYGVQRFWAAREKGGEWKNGDFTEEDARLAVQIGQIATTLNIQGEEADALNGVTLQKLENLTRTGGHFSDIGNLRMILREFC